MILLDNIHDALEHLLDWAGVCYNTTIRSDH